MKIRPVLSSEAEKFWEMLDQIDHETKFMMFEPGERPRNIDRLAAAIADGNPTFFVADDTENASFAGYMLVERGRFNRNRHSAYIVVGVKAEYQHQGVGSQLFAQLDEWATDNDITRLELTVMATNTNAQNLYKKFGFKVEGVKEKSLLVDGVYVDELYMAKTI
ncbi:MAG: GNAT family N-acetyltransferase [Streptococcaceae bacterium]|nr:GNAT family N-acetyltransferase [Streptococcaceae bacterium]